MSDSEMEDSVVDAIRGASRIVALTGAGVSAESGIPTFRDALEGLWATFDPEQLATPQAFQRDPALVTRPSKVTKRFIQSSFPILSAPLFGTGPLRSGN